MTTTTDVVHNRTSPGDIYRRHGYFFREAAMLTISIGMVLHIARIIFGDDFALRYVITPTTDRILLVPMTYAAITGFVVLRRVKFANGLHRVFFTASVVYIAASVPLHIYTSYIVNSTQLVIAFPMWYSYFLLIAVFPAFLTMFWRLRYKH
jgi:hypothetical protein